MKKIILLLIACCCFLIQTQANIDSLWSIWNNESLADTTRAKALDDIAWDGYLYNQPDSALIISKMMYDFSKSKGLKKLMSNALATQGQSYSVQGNYRLALQFFQKSRIIREELIDKQGIASCLNNMGIVYMQQSNYPKALEEFQQSIKLYEELDDKNGMALALGNIGIIYIELVDYPNALDYNQRSLDLHTEIKNQRGMATSNINVGLVYMEQKKYPKALEYYNRSLKIFEDLGNKYGIAYALRNIANIHDLQGDYPKAMAVHQRSLRLYEEISDRNGLASAYSNIGLIYAKQGQHRRAIMWCLKSQANAEKIGANKEEKDACECLYEAYNALNNSKEALRYHVKMTALDDSLNDVETAKKLQQMEFGKQMLADSLTQVDKDRVVQTKHANTRNALTGTAFLILLLAGGVYTRLRYVRKSKATLQIEKDRSENLLLNILPAEIAAELKEKGKADARDFEMVSILFTDFKGFTEQSAKLSAQDLVASINQCFEAFDNIMQKYDVEKIKTIGDAYMAAGGLPIPTKDSAKNTVLAALEMQDFITKLHLEKEAKGEHAFEMRVGIHTGPVVAGIVGVKKFQYDIWGDTVNTAARMESNGQVSKVNISRATYELVKDSTHSDGVASFTFEHRGKIEAKGKGEIEMWFVSKNA